MQASSIETETRTEAPTETPIETGPETAQGWTPQRKARFLDHLSVKGNVRAACARVGLSPEAAYRLRRRDEEFGRAWIAALGLARARSEQVLADRAIDGIEEAIYYRGELVGTRRKFDTRLLLSHLARLDKLVEGMEHPNDIRRFDELVAVIAGEEGPALAPSPDPPAVDKPARPAKPESLPPDREAYALRAAEIAFHRAFAPFEEAAARASDEGVADDPSVEEPGEAFLAECHAASEAAGEAARAEWEAWRNRACDAVDASCGWPASPVASGLPGKPFAAARKALAASRPAPRTFSPWTASTPSTSALATALAGPAQGFRPPPLPLNAASSRRRMR